ncbi:hypothetical protein EI94DRAFT_1700483 [Lactarius quietus]|nr:hypothetical protein EI94DRAFT_1700483 [Lactarius quietus]
MAKMKMELRGMRWDDTKVQQYQDVQAQNILEAQHALDANFQRENGKWMKIMWEKYQGLVIWQTVNLLDRSREPISRLVPYEEHNCLLLLFDHKYEALETLTVNLLDSKSVVSHFLSKVCAGHPEANRNILQKFYLDICKSLLHLCFAAGMKTENIVENYEEYVEEQSSSLLTKINGRMKMFKDSSQDGPCVLLLLNVGSVGLNITFANVLVIVVYNGFM